MREHNIYGKHCTRPSPPSLADLENFLSSMNSLLSPKQIVEAVNGVDCSNANHVVCDDPDSELKSHYDKNYLLNGSKNVTPMKLLV